MTLIEFSNIKMKNMYLGETIDNGNVQFEVEKVETLETSDGIGVILHGLEIKDNKVRIECFSGFDELPTIIK